MVDFEVIKRMMTYGSDFENLLARLWLLADSVERKRIEECFSNRFDRFKFIIENEKRG